MCLILWGATAFSQPSPQDLESELVTYGELTVREAPQDWGPHSFSLNVGLETANAYRDVYQAFLRYQVRLHPLFEVGVLGKFFSSQATALLDELGAEAGLFGLEIQSRKPVYAYYLRLTFVPLRGRLNFLGLSSLPYTLAFTVGPGQRVFQGAQKLWGYFWSLESRLGMATSWSLNMNFSQESEGGFEAGPQAHRHELSLGVAYHF